MNRMMINKNSLKTIHEVSKSLKCSLICIKNSLIYGTDENFIHLKYTSQTVTDLNIIFYIGDLNDMMKNIDEIPDDEINIFQYLQIHYEFIDPFDRLIFSAQSNLLNNRITFTVDDLKANDNFNEINAMKSTEGMALLKLSERYILTLFNGLLPINKADKVQLFITDIDQYRYLTNFVIDKKKYKINVLLMYLFIGEIQRGK